MGIFCGEIRLQKNADSPAAPLKPERKARTVKLRLLNQFRFVSFMYGHLSMERVLIFTRILLCSSSVMTPFSNSVSL